MGLESIESTKVNMEYWEGRSYWKERVHRCYISLQFVKINMCGVPYWKVFYCSTAAFPHCSENWKFLLTSAFDNE